MKKKYIIYIGVVIVIISSLITLVVLSSKGKNNQPHTYKVYTKISDKMDHKESFLVYFRNDDPYKCNTCKKIDNVIDFYEDIYGLKFMIYDTDYKNEIIKLDLKFNLEPGFITNPAVLIVKDGEMKAIANDFYDEIFLKQELVDNGFIDEKSANIETEIIDDKDFDRIFKEDKKQLIVVYSNKNLEMRKLLYDIAMNDSYFQYYSIVKGIFANYNSFMTLSNFLQDEMNDTTLVVVKNEKIVDKISSFNRSKVKKFLKKNEIINK